MLRVWKAFVVDNEKGQGYPEFEPWVEDKDIVVANNKYGLVPVTALSQEKPRVIFIGGLLSLTTGRIHPNQTLKLYSYLKKGGINPEDIDLYLPIYEKETDPKIPGDHSIAYNSNPKSYSSPEGKELSHMIFTDSVIPDLNTLDSAARASAVSNLKLLASKTTFLGFSYGPTLIEDTFNNLIERFKEKHWSPEEIREVTGSLLSFHIASANPVVEKTYNLPQINQWALNDKTARQASNYPKFFNRNQHMVMLDARPFPDALMMAAAQIPGTYTTFSLHSTDDRTRAKLYATMLPKDDVGNPRYDKPVGKNYIKPTSRHYAERHNFDLFTATTHLIREDYKDPQKTSFVLQIFGMNSIAQPFLESIAKGIHASIQSNQTHTPRDSRAVLEEVHQSLTPAAKDKYVIRTIRDIIEERMMGRYAKHYNLFADRLLGKEFPAWAREEAAERDKFLRGFDERAQKVFSGKDTLKSFIKWSNKYTERSGRLPGDEYH